MSNRLSAPVLVVFAALGVACRSESVFQPELATVHYFTALELSPSTAELFTVRPMDSVQLSLAASDQTGARPWLQLHPAYSSSAPEIAAVSSSGAVTPVARGAAIITASLALGGVTRTASMIVAVHGQDEPLDENSEIAGIYDLTALIQDSRGWGYEGWRETAVITIQHYTGSTRFAGTFQDFGLADSSGTRDGPLSSGTVTGTIDPDRRVVVQLSFGVGTSSGWYGKGTADSRDIVGSFTGGEASGVFTAIRRAAPTSSSPPGGGP